MVARTIGVNITRWRHAMIHVLVSSTFTSEGVADMDRDEANKRNKLLRKKKISRRWRPAVDLLAEKARLKEMEEAK